MFDWSENSIWVYHQPIDMRRGFEFLSQVVEREFNHNLVDGSVYLFLGAHRKRAKVLHFDGTGLVLVTKRLDKGMFQGISTIAKQGSITLEQLQYLFAGSHINFPMEVESYRRNVITKKSNGFDEKNFISQ